jgi:hypothetical protein
MFSLADLEQTYPPSRVPATVPRAAPRQPRCTCTLQHSATSCNATRGSIVLVQSHLHGRAWRTTRARGTALEAHALRLRDRVYGAGLANVGADSDWNTAAEPAADVCYAHAIGAHVSEGRGCARVRVRVRACACVRVRVLM